MEKTSPSNQVLIPAEKVRQVYEADEHTHASLAECLGVSRETATRFLSRGVLPGCNPHALSKLQLMFDQLESAARWRRKDAIVFRMEEALSFGPLTHDFNVLRQGDVKATLYNSNQTLELEMQPDSLAAHALDTENRKLVTIKVLSGSIILKYALTQGHNRERLVAGTKQNGAFSIPTPYSLSAEEQSHVLVFCRPDACSVSDLNSDEE